MSNEDLITKARAARILGVSPAYITILEKNGRLPAELKLSDGTRVFKRETVERFAKERQKRKNPPSSTEDEVGVY